MLTNDQLVGLLDQWDVHFLTGGTALPQAQEIDPAQLLAALAMSDEARLRLAIIPLLLRHPEIVLELPLTMEQLPAAAQIVLKCYYTAAYLLQQKYQSRLQALFAYFPALPNRFGNELGLQPLQSVDEQLAALAQCQRVLSGRSINWLGTYEHGAERLLRYYEQKQKWHRSQ